MRVKGFQQLTSEHVNDSFAAAFLSNVTVKLYHIVGHALYFGVVSLVALSLGCPQMSRMSVLH